MIHERFRAKRAAGQPVFGTSLRFRDAGIVEMIGGGWDFVWIDLQHGTIGADQLLDIVRACDLVGVTSLVRMPLNPSGIGWALDMDVGGVIIAQVDTVCQACAAVKAARFPPVGDRSYGGRRIIDRQGGDYTMAANLRQLLFLQVESPQALDACAEWVALEGVDGLMLGPDDIRLRLGQPLSGSMMEGPLYEASMKLVNTCRAASKLTVMIVPPQRAEIGKALQMGATVISLSADATFLKTGSAAALSEASAAREAT